MALAAGEIIRAADLIPEEWQDLPLLSSMGPRPGYFPPAFRKIAGGGSVEVTGAAYYELGVSSGVVIARLPVGYRPSSPVGIVIATNGASSISGEVRTNGDISVTHALASKPSTLFLYGVFPLSR